ncbi:MULTISPECIES: AAA family ATPase [Trueperella]|uniref:ATPase AAA-type core domain-containing protein n=1 Tax=Trueperella abortisuis TaxID=445930 RepID=A0ABT9PLQ9_9ACTO|nr:MULTISPECIES: AAA family ATPase [Trueperella]MCI7305245.1 AAA family ATPase [Trueperella sp.]MDP9833401.1 hypothetical protein [Trueperella abortisuis]
MFISFAVENFRAFADRAELDFACPGFDTVLPREGKSWTDVLSPVTAIFGANASGKSTLIMAIEVLGRAVWQQRAGRFLYQPSLACAEPSPTTNYEADFVVNGIRYRYTVRAADWGVAFEELRSYENRWPRKIFSRSQESLDMPMKFSKGAALRGPSDEVRKLTKASALYLAVALDYGHAGLESIAEALAAGRGIQSFPANSRSRFAITERIIQEMLAGGSDAEDLAEALLRVADVGIESVKVKQERIPPALLERMRRSMGDPAVEDEMAPNVPEMRSKVVFVHRGAGGKTFELALDAQSAGTQVWLVMSWRALTLMKNGGILLVDELDESLHPSLVRFLVELFLNPEYNRKHAQIIFTTQDSGLLGNSPVRLLEPASVWFTEKNDEGRSELFSLADYPIHPNSNFEKRYLAGAYGAIPSIDDRSLVRWLEN